ncbi:MAG: DNA repair protein RecO [Acidobacteria bacterium]|nr:DNA repair protein RecO [Acidobacteriota bacterium]
MPLHDMHAFVLRSFTLKEADKICVLLTREAGQVRGVAKGARRLRSRFGASLEPFTEVQITYYQNESKELVALSSCEIVQSNFAAGISSERLGVIHYLTELLIEFTPAHEPNERVYRLVTATVETLKVADDAQLVALTRYFEVWLLKLAGFLADMKSCGDCSRAFTESETIWLDNEGQPHCRTCCDGAGDALVAVTRQTLQAMLKQAPQNFLTTNPDAVALQSLGGITIRLIHRALERAPKSYELLTRLRPVATN